MKIQSKSDVYHLFNVTKKVFDRAFLPSLLVVIGWDLKQWRKHHKKVFPLEIIKKIVAFHESDEIQAILER